MGASLSKQNVDTKLASTPLKMLWFLATLPYQDNALAIQEAKLILSPPGFGATRYSTQKIPTSSPLSGYVDSALTANQLIPQRGAALCSIPERWYVSPCRLRNLSDLGAVPTMIPALQ